MLLEIVVGQFEDGGRVVVPEELCEFVAGSSGALEVDVEPFFALEEVSLPSDELGVVSTHLFEREHTAGRLREVDREHALK